jgi:hypothetical protein
VLCFDYPAYHATGVADPEVFDPDRWERLSAKDAHHIPFGEPANRSCPAWRLAPLVMRAATKEVLDRFTLHSSVSHTRSMPHRAPCLRVPRGRPLPRPRRTALLLGMRFRDRWEDVGRSLLQLCLGSWMVADARRQRLTVSYFAHHDTQGRPTAGPDGSAAAPRAARPEARCPYPHPH